MTILEPSGVRARELDTAYVPPPASVRGHGVVTLYTAITAIVLALLMLFGLAMRASQAGVITIPPNRFYELLTAHGIGMVAISGLGGAAVMWYFLSRYVTLSRGILLANLACFLAGGVLVLGVGFLLLYLDTGRAIIRTYGSLGTALGWPQAFGKSTAEAPPPTVVASTIVTI